MDGIPKFQITRSNRQSISLQISHNGELIVKAPYLVPKFVIERFITTKRDWIHTHMDLATKYNPKNKSTVTVGDEYSFLGKEYLIQTGSGKEITLTQTLNIPKFLMFRANVELTQWYISQAKNIITDRVKYQNTIMKTDYRRITYSDTISKWGSCGADNSLQFNWRLVMAPLVVIDYVVVHELAHTKEKNHGRKFWDIVSRYKPAYRQYVKWLKTNSYKLHSVLK
jgi:predicted metal-dependent hydrolase